MKRCPTCDKTFDDSMRFCQTDGTPLVDDAPPIDPYATMVAKPGDIIPPAAETPEAAAPIPAPIDEPAEVLDLPSDPMKTMVASAEEMRAALAAHDDPGMEIPEAPAAPMPEPPKFSEPEIAPPTFDTPAAAPPPPPPPPSPFGGPPPSPMDMPTPEENLPPIEDEPATVLQPMQSAPTPAFEQFPEPPAAEASASQSPFGQDISASAAQPPAAGDWQPMAQQESGMQAPPPAPAGQSSTLAIVSLVLGVLSLLCCMWFIPGIAAIIVGFMARGKAKNDPMNYGGAGLALGGIICGAISLVLGVVVAILYFLGFAASLMR